MAGMESISMQLRDFFHLPSVPSASLRNAVATAPPLVDFGDCRNTARDRIGDHGVSGIRSSSNFLLIGPERSGKTSLLTHLAYNLTCRGNKVVVLSSRSRLEGSPPMLGQKLSQNDPNWSKIGIKYIQDYTSALRYASLLHLLPEAPNVILIDDIDEMIDCWCLVDDPNEGTMYGKMRNKGSFGWPSFDSRSKDMATCRLLAVFLDSLDFIQSSCGKPAVLGASVTCPSIRDAATMFPLYKRWLPCIIGCGSIPASKKIGEHESSGSLSIAAMTSDGPLGTLVQYSIDDGHLKIENVYKI